MFLSRHLTSLAQLLLRWSSHTSTRPSSLGCGRAEHDDCAVCKLASFESRVGGMSGVTAPSEGGCHRFVLLHPTTRADVESEQSLLASLVHFVRSDAARKVTCWPLEARAASDEGP